MSVLSKDVDGGWPDHRAIGSSAAILGLFRRGDMVLGFPASRLAEVARVVSVLPMLERGRACVGSIDLRGLHVPLIDLPSLMNAHTDPMAPAKADLAAVLSVDGRMVAVGVDRVLELARIPVERPSGAAGVPTLPGDRPRGFALIHRGALVNIVDPADLVLHPEVSTVPDRRSATLALSRAQRRQMIQFDVGGAVLAIPAVDINATLPRRTIDRNALTGGICLGSIDLPQGQVAVVSASALFGIGTPSLSETSEVIVVPMSNGAYIGLAVARILRIAEIDLAQAVVMPRGVGEGLLSASLVESGDTALFLVDPEALRLDDHLRELAAVTKRDSVPTAQGPRNETASREAAQQSIERRRDRYLLLDAGVRLAAKIASVTRILPMPQTIIPLAGTDPRVIGLAVIGREVLPLVRPDGTDFPISEATRVLIVDTDRSRVAFAVRRVLGVITSSWRTRTDRSDTGGSVDRSISAGLLIRAEAGAESAAASGLHRAIDLSAEADALARSLPAARRGEPVV